MQLMKAGIPKPIDVGKRRWKLISGQRWKNSG
jgi:hypothetical protein